jgi:pyruvate dehydrogenase E1 component
MECDAARLRGEERTPYVTRALSGAPGPVVAVSDWMRAVPDQIAQWVEQPWTSIGTDGFGLSDTRDAARRHFGVDPQSLAVQALAALARSGEVETAKVKEAAERYGL